MGRSPSLVRGPMGGGDPLPAHEVTEAPWPEPAGPE